MVAVSGRIFADLALRGPDSRGFHAFGPGGALLGTDRDPAGIGASPCSLLLGQTRLSILDLSEAGRQPMTSRDGRHTLVYNGEIYNYLELRRELQALGVAFHTQTDTEVLLQALRFWGEACLPRLAGMFAFALHDARTGRILCARDFFGIKPFYYARPEGGFAFASELPALLRFPGVARRVDWTQAYNFLLNGRTDVGGECFVEGVRQLPPAHLMEVDAASGELLRLEQYWQVPLPAPARISFADAAAELRRLFLQSVQLHLRSDVPLGVALSGGLDSSAIACAIRHLHPDFPLHTFTFVAAGSDVCEEAWADQVARHVGAVAHKVAVRPDELAQEVDQLILRLGEPFGSTSIYAQHRVFRLAKECGITVTLDGQGADELLAGYAGFPVQRVQSLLRRGRALAAWRTMAVQRNWPGRAEEYPLARYLGAFVPHRLRPVALRLAGRTPAPPWINMAEVRARGADRLLPRDQNLYRSPDKVRRTLANALTWNGLPALLRHGDRNSMSFSIESRVPFLTRDMTEFLLSLPEHYLVDDSGQTKAVFREAMRGILPEAVRTRRDKIGFATPERQWLESLSPWVEETLRSDGDSLLVRRDEALADWRAIRDGRRPFDWRVWRWLNYLRWRRLLGMEE